MLAGALYDLGVPEEIFNNSIASLGLGEEIHLHFQRGSRQGISGWKFEVHSHESSVSESHTTHVTPHHHHHHHDSPTKPHIHGRNAAEILHLIQTSKLSEPVKQRAASVFRRIAVAEGRIHGVPPDQVRFHEVGAADSIADITCCCAAIDYLRPVKVIASALVEGTGHIQCAHGEFPLPAPATAEILAGIPLRQIDLPCELITPTGAALLAEFSDYFGPIPPLQIEKIGYGLGTRDIEGRPNVLRIFCGKTETQQPEGSLRANDEVVVLECQIDDCSPEILATVPGSLLSKGALDVFLTPITMKKGRCGHLITVLTKEKFLNVVAQHLFEATTTFGVRLRREQRIILERHTREVSTEFGPVLIKFGTLNGRTLQVQPEFDSCLQAAERTGVPLRRIFQAAQAAAFQDSSQHPK